MLLHWLVTCSMSDSPPPQRVRLLRSPQLPATVATASPEFALTKTRAVEIWRATTAICLSAPKFCVIDVMEVFVYVVTWWVIACSGVMRWGYLRVRR